VPGEPSVGVFPTPAHVGDRVAVTGVGYVPGADVVVTALSMRGGGHVGWRERGYAETARVNAQGVFHLSLVLTTRVAPAPVHDAAPPLTGTAGRRCGRVGAFPPPCSPRRWPASPLVCGGLV